MKKERNITKRMKQYEEKYDFINKALLESVAQITEMTKTDHPTAAARVKSADKMVMLPPLFNGSKPEVAKQHYKRFNQYIKFTFDPQKTDVDKHIDSINTLGDMLGQTAESKMEKFTEKMPTIIQTHLIICKSWAKTTKRAKELEHIIRRCDPI